MDFVIVHSKTLLDVLPLLLAGYLLIIGLAIIITKYQFSELLAFAFTSVWMGVILLNPTDMNQILPDISSLLFWPSFYLFLNLQRKKITFRRYHLAHLVPPLIWLTINPLVSENYNQDIFNALYLFQWLIYLWLCLTEIHKSNQSTKIKANYKAGYFKILFIGIIILIVLRLLLPIFEQDYLIQKVILDIATAFYVIIVSSYFIQSPLFFADSIQPTEEVINYEEVMKRKLNSIMQKEKLFLNPELNLNGLSDKLEIKVTELSIFLNTTLNKNFNDFVNEYRVKEFKKLIEDPATDKKATVMELAYKAGFNSKASFNRIFKEATGITPTEYRKLTKLDKTA